MRNTPLRYGKETARRWRSRLEALHGEKCCICERRAPITERLFDRKWSAAIFAGGEPLSEETLSMLWVDHNHATGIVRGLLCSDCNAAIWPFEFGRAMDDVTRRYLAEGERRQRAEAHMHHLVVKTADRGLRLLMREKSD